MTLSDVCATGRREIGMYVETLFHDFDGAATVWVWSSSDSADTAKVCSAGVCVALCILQQATNLAFSSGENSRSRTSVRKLDSLTGFPVQADPPRVQETGESNSKIVRQNCEADGR